MKGGTIMSEKGSCVQELEDLRKTDPSFDNFVKMVLEKAEENIQSSSSKKGFFVPLIEINMFVPAVKMTNAQYHALKNYLQYRYLSITNADFIDINKVFLLPFYHIKSGSFSLLD